MLEVHMAIQNQQAKIDELIEQDTEKTAKIDELTKHDTEKTTKITALNEEIKACKDLLREKHQ